MTDRKFFTAWLLAIAFCAIPLYATHTEFWRTSSFKGFLKGNLEGVSVSMDGELTLAPETRAIFNPDETVALSVVAARNGSLYIGTGHQGKVFELDQDRHGRLLFQAPEPEILALAIGPDHALYVGSSPEGKIYRVTPQGKSSVFYDPKVKYIWALAFDPEGRLYVGTGDRGEILRIDRDGRGGVFFASNQTHIMCLTFDRSGNLLAGSEPNGLIYRISPQGKAFVLYQANLPEIHALATDAQGRIYAAALGNNVPGAVPGYVLPSTSPTLVSSPATTVTVVASAGNTADDPVKTQQPQQPQQPQRAPQRRGRAPSVNPNVSAGVQPYHQYALGRGALIEILPNYTAQTLWTSNNESIFGLATRGSDVLFSTDANGHIFDLKPSPDGPKLTLLTETRESLPTRILPEGSDLFVATSNIAKLIQIGTTMGTEGTYESQVKDAGFISHWGEISWRAEVPAHCGLQFYTRSGNSARPDNTWSNWAGPYTNPPGSAIQSPPARYVQWKAVFHGSDGQSPSLVEVSLAYLNQNLPPEIRNLTITAGNEKTSLSGIPIISSNPVMTVTPISTVTTSGNPPTVYDTSGGQVVSKHPIYVSWQAEDPNRDQITYSLYIKSADEQQWHLLKGNLRDTNFTLEPDSLADGEYQIRLVASDEASNPPDRALKTELVSAPFWVDNTPPAILTISQQVDGRTAVIRFQALSKVSPLEKAEVSTGEDHWKEILSDDGIVDSQRETFTVRLQGLAPGEHVISLRAYDTAGNIGIGKAVIEVQ
jgi:hypothetical protein